MLIKHESDCPEIIANDGCRLRELLHPDRAGQERSLKRFQQEAAMLKRLEHPNILKATDSGDQHIVLEPVEGMAPEYPGIVQRYLGAGAEAYLAPMRDRVRSQRRIRVRVRSWRVLDFVKRFPRSLR